MHDGRDMIETTEGRRIMRKAVILALAGVLVAGIGVVAWGHDAPHEATASARGIESAPDGGFHRRGVRDLDRAGILADTLSELVADGTITQEQMDAIVTAIEEKKSAIAAERSRVKELLESFWSDGVLTSAEIAQLPFAYRFTDPDGPFADALEDGQITKEEFEAIAKEFRGAKHKRRRHFGQGGAGADAA